MVGYVDTNMRVWYARSWGDLIENVVANMTEDIERLKRDVKLRDEQIVALQKIVGRKCDIIGNYQNRVESLHEENDMRGDKIEEMQKTLDLHYNIIASDLTRINALREENDALTKKNAQLTLYNENQAKTIALVMNVNPFWVCKKW